MTQTSDRPARAPGPEQLARWAAAGQLRALEEWPRVVEALTRATLHAERAWLVGASVLPWSTLVVDGPHVDEGWTATAQQAQRAAADLWRTGVEACVQQTYAATIELRSSAVQLLEQLEDERARCQRAEDQRDRERARAEREITERQAAERAREAERQRANDEHGARQHAERTVERLERELAHERERVASAKPSETAEAAKPAATARRRKPTTRRP